MSQSLSEATAFTPATTARGKAALPPDADPAAFAAQLRRAIHTIECRELGPAAAKQRFGSFADLQKGHVSIVIDADTLLARHPHHQELRDLIEAVRERGPAVDVLLMPPGRP